MPPLVEKLIKPDIRLPDYDARPVGSASVARWLWYFAQPYRHIIAAFIGYRVVRYIYIALLPLLIGFVINGFESGRAQENPGFYAAVMGGYLLIFSSMMLTNHVFTLEAGTYEKVTRILTLISVRHINALPLDWHEREGSGGKMQRVMTARKGLSELGIIFRWVMFPVFGNLSASIFTVLTLDAPLYYIPLYMAFCATYLYASHRMGRPIPKLYDRYNEKFEKLMSGVYEFVSSIRTVKAFHLQRYIGNKAEVLESEGQGAINTVLFKMFTRWIVMNAVGCSWIAFFAFYGFYNAFTGTISIGAYASTFFLAYNLWIAMEMLGTTQDQLFQHMSGLRRLMQTLAVKPVSLDIAPVTSMPQDWTTLSLSGVTYHYQDGKGAGVDAISFTLKRGEKAAFVGVSGAGKSTLAKLLMKQMLPQSGAIAIDRMDLKHIRSEEWLSRIGFVPQDVELFNMSLRENIIIDREDVTQETYRAALRHAALEEFVDSLPEGDSTLIGERGIRLSGGQRQRLGIARALIRRPDIIIFDEATSALDSLSEQIIHKAMEQSFKDRTVFMIAHRLSTVRHVDTIIVLENGRVVEQGTFEALIAANGAFAKLWALQSGKKTQTPEEQPAAA